jgi:DNA primase
MNSPFFSLQLAKQIDIVEYLEKLSHRPQKIRNHDYWYRSPLRDEKEPSFKVNRKLNVWYDHGMGEGGNIIDFGILYHHCSVAELLKKLQDIFSFHQQTLTVQQPPPNTQKLSEALEPKIKVIAAKRLTHPLLCRYLDDRKIPLEVAKKYCQEVEFELYTNKYFAIGFENKSGGFELRSEHFKGSSSPKDVTLIEGDNSNNIAVFEGFFSFLSYQTLLQNNPSGLTNFLVLNSLSFFEKSLKIMEQHEQIHLHLDGDNAGFKHTNRALQWSEKYIDQSHLYKFCKDLNEYLVQQPQHLKQSRRLGRRQ